MCAQEIWTITISFLVGSFTYVSVKLCSQRDYYVQSDKSDLGEPQGFTHSLVVFLIWGYFPTFLSPSFFQTNKSDHRQMLCCQLFFFLKKIFITLLHFNIVFIRSSKMSQFCAQQFKNPVTGAKGNILAICKQMYRKEERGFKCFFRSPE